MVTVTTMGTGLATSTFRLTLTVYACKSDTSRYRTCREIHGQTDKHCQPYMRFLCTSCKKKDSKECSMRRSFHKKSWLHKCLRKCTCVSIIWQLKAHNYRNTSFSKVCRTVDMFACV
jgi:hypothetical protein